MAPEHSKKIRIATAFLTLMLVVSSFAPFAVPKAHAQLPVIDVAAIAGLATIAAGTSATGVNTTYSAHIKPILDGLAWAVAKATIQSITRSMVNWINSGFNGSPAFVTNLDRTLLSVSDGAANSFFNGLSSGSGASSPFQSIITQQLRNSYYSSTGRLSPNAGYNLNAFTNNPRALLQGQLSNNGGLNAWFALTNNPQNNPFGALYVQGNALSGAIAGAVNNRTQELNWGRGFLSWRGSCAVKGPVTDQSTDMILNGGVTTNLSSADNCLQYNIQTPGSTVEDVLGITATSPLRQLELANSVNEIVGALASQMVNQILGGGGLLGLNKPSAGGGPSVLNQATDPSQYLSNNSSLAAGVIQNIANDSVTAQTYLTDWQNLKAKAQSCVSSSATVTNALNTATGNVARGTNAVAAINQVNTDAQTAAGAADPNTALTAVSTEYQNLIATSTPVVYKTAAGATATTSPAYITQADLTDAQTQSSPAVAGTTSLFSTLTALCGA